MASVHANGRLVRRPVQQQAEVPQEAPRRLMRISRTVKAETAPAQNDTARIAAILQLIAKNTEKIEALAVENEKATAELEAALREAKMVGYTDGSWEATIMQVMSKTSKDIDPAKVKAALKPEDFMAVIKVSATALKGYMSEREIDAVSKITPAKVTGTKLVVNKVAVRISTKARISRK